MSTFSEPNPVPRRNASKYVGYTKATFRVRPDLLDRLRKTSFFSRRDMSEIVNKALEQYLPDSGNRNVD